MSGLHLSDETLAALVEGRLDEAGLATVHGHVDVCATCHELVVLMAGSYFAEKVPQEGPAQPAAEVVPDIDSLTPANMTAELPWRPPSYVHEFKILSELGSGAMGQVYVAHDTLLDRSVAIKFIAERRFSQATRERFLNEARAVAKMSHPNVVAVHRIGDLDGRPYIVSELVRGQSMDRLPHPLPWEQVLQIGVDLARGLNAAHRRGILHRDIKPANAILSADGPAKLLDFGLAKLLLPVEAEGADATLYTGDEILAQSGNRLTRTAEGFIVGTPLYMAPEVLCGGSFSRRSDVFALGALVYELLCGRPPFRATSLHALRQALLEQEATPTCQAAPGVDARFAATIDRCLRRAPQERPADGEELCESLLRINEPLRHAAVPDCNPYLGLRAFDAEHRALFFGRHREIREVTERLRSDPLVIVAGDSGAGKSSLCRAGILPFIAERWSTEGRTWSSQTMLPGARPLTTLIAVLAPLLQMPESAAAHLANEEPDSLWRALQARLGRINGVVLFVDQLEELLTQSAEAEADRFSELLGYACSPLPGVRILAAVRGDFLTKLSRQPGFARALVPALYLLRPLDPEDLREAISGPARLLGYSYESESLLDELTTATRTEHGGLPLLQFTLRELWEHRNHERHIIPASALEKLGGVTGTLERHADAVIARLLPEQRLAARGLLVRLVTPQRTRDRRTESALLGNAPAEQAALAALVDSRLVVARLGAAGDTEYELTHEALLSAWPTLRRWLELAGERHDLEDRLRTAAVNWERLGKSDELLYGERQLKECERFELDEAALPPLPASFLLTSRRVAARRRNLWRSAQAAVPLLIMTFAALGFGIWRERESRQLADRTARTEMGLRASSLARQVGQEVPALISAVRAVTSGTELTKALPPAARDGLIDTVQVSRRSLPLRKHGNLIRAMAFSPDGTLLASAPNDPPARVFDANTGKELAVLVGHVGQVVSVAFSPDGTRLVTGGEDDSVRIWEARSGHLLHSMLGHHYDVIVVAFSPDGRRVASASRDRTVRIWDAMSGRQLHVLEGHTDDLLNLAFFPDGKRLLTCSLDRTARIWDVEIGALQATLEGHLQRINAVAVSPDGQEVLTVSDDHSARLWNTASGMTDAILGGHEDSVIAGAFSPDGKRLITASRDQTARLWDAKDGRLLLTFSGHSGPLLSAAFMPDGTRVLTASRDQTARIWDAKTGIQLGILRGHDAPVTLVTADPRGRIVATSSEDHTIRLWSGHTGEQAHVLRGHQDLVFHAEFSPDNTMIATASWDGTARIWDGASGRPLCHLVGHQGKLGKSIFSPDSHMLVTGGEDGALREWDTSTCKLLRTLEGHQNYIHMVAFSPDGRLIASGSKDETVRVWDAVTGKALHTLGGQAGAIWSVAFSPDGTKIAAGSMKGVARVWWVKSGSMAAELTGHRAGIPFIGFSPDGEFIVTASEDQTARIWDSESGRLCTTLAGHTDEIWTAAVAADGRIATGSGDNTVRLWSRRGELLGVLRGHTDKLRHVVFSPDGRRLATSSFDLTTRLWDGQTGAELATLRGHKAWITMSAFSPDGRRIVTASADGTARLWDAFDGHPLVAQESDELLAPVLDPEEDAAVAHHRQTESLAKSLTWACRLLWPQPEYAEVAIPCQKATGLR